MFGKKEIKDFLEALGKKLSRELTVYLIGGGGMSLMNLKPSTVDIDMVVESEKDFESLKKALLSSGYEYDKDIADLRVYNDAVVVFRKGDSRIDIFIKTICAKLTFSPDMIKRSSLFGKFGKLKVMITSKEDMFLFKSVTDRPGDVPDCERLIRESLDWNIIVKECIEQSQKTQWIFWMYEQICRVEERYKVKIPAKQRIYTICRKHWDKKPDDFLHDLKDRERHLGAEGS